MEERAIAQVEVARFGSPHLRIKLRSRLGGLVVPYVPRAANKFHVEGLEHVLQVLDCVSPVSIYGLEQDVILNLGVVLVELPKICFENQRIVPARHIRSLQWNEYVTVLGAKPAFLASKILFLEVKGFLECVESYFLLAACHEHHLAVLDLARLETHHGLSALGNHMDVNLVLLLWRFLVNYPDDIFVLHRAHITPRNLLSIYNKWHSQRDSNPQSFGS